METQELNTVLVWLEGISGPFQLVFRSPAAAKLALDGIVAPAAEMFSVSDDFGRTLQGCSRHLIAATLHDIASELNGQCELQLIQAHANAKLQRRVATDPLLRPSMVQPNTLPGLPSGFQRN
jgi:hypothetical protein